MHAHAKGFGSRSCPVGALPPLRAGSPLQVKLGCSALTPTPAIQHDLWGSASWAWGLVPSTTEMQISKLLVAQDWCHFRGGDEHGLRCSAQMWVSTKQTLKEEAAYDFLVLQY